MDEELVQIPESVPSPMDAPEPTTPRFFGSLGLGAVGVGTLALILNNYGPRLVGPTVATWLIILGSAGMLYHAARDADQMVRRLYLLLGFAVLGAGVALSSVPRGGIAGEWFVPWGVLGLLAGLLLILGAGRQEHEPPWDGLATWFLVLIGVAASIIGMVGVALSITYLPRLASVAILGLVFWWAAIARLGSVSDSGYRFGQLLGLVGLVALLFAISRSVAPVLATSASRYFMPQGVVLGTLGLMALAISFGVCSDRPVVVMARRELGAYFYSPVAYLVLFGVSFIAWLGFYTFVENLLQASANARDPIREPVIRYYAAGFFSAVSIMFVVPAITMRLLSEERRTGTIEVLLTGPVNEWQVVISKFLAGLIFFLVLSIPWGLFLVPMFFLGRTGFDYLPLISYYLALVCSGAAFIAMGLFFSSLTRNQVIAAVLTFAGMFLFLAFLFLQESIGAMRPVVDQLSFYTMWINALSGQLQVHRLITFLSIAVFWLYLTTRVLEARKWS